jgi:hypothetical protein
MTTIRFIVQGSPDSAPDNAYELQQYLQNNWQATVQTRLLNFQKAEDAPSRSLGFDPDSIQILLETLAGLKLVIDTAHGVLETRTQLKELMEWAEKTFTHEHEYLWIEVGGIPYPVKVEKLDDILIEMKKQG